MRKDNQTGLVQPREPQVEGRMARETLTLASRGKDVLARERCRLGPTEGTQPAAVPSNRAEGSPWQGFDPRTPETPRQTEIRSKTGHIDRSWHCSR
jgi:hypothetical protein